MNSGRCCRRNSVRGLDSALGKLYLASSNQGKLREYEALAGGSAPVDLELVPGFRSLPAFDESAPTFAENALGKALYYSQLVDGLVFADDSGLVVPALGGAPGVLSARYAGTDATAEQRNEKFLRALSGKSGAERRAFFVCAIALVERGRAVAVMTDRVDGEILDAPRGVGGFGYDPVFYFPPLRKGFAELSAEEKNEHSHRGKAFRKLIGILRKRL
jgi:XTP/dITP diphosphohydrolase